MQVSVIAPPYEQWPLPWYLRTMPIVGYWTRTDDPLALQAPVIVSSMEFAPRSMPRSATATCRSSTASGPRWC